MDLTPTGRDGPFIEDAQFELLQRHIYALALFGLLSWTQGPGADFTIPDRLHERLGPKWSRRSIPAARKKLLELNIIECVKPHGRTPALYRWLLSHE